MNLVVITDNTSRAAAIGELVGEVSVTNPSRILLLVLDPGDSESGLDAWVSARCSLPLPGRNQVCCEEITLTAGGPASEKAAGIVTTLLVPDLPTVVIWKSYAGLEGSVLSGFFPFADRVIIDSSEREHPEDVLLSWARLIAPGDSAGSTLGAGSSETLFGDLSWTHLTPWRSLLARAFQPLEIRDILSDIGDVAIEYSVTPTPAHSGLAQAYLLVAWLASRLGWTSNSPFSVSSENERRADFQSASGGPLFAVRLGRTGSGSGAAGGLESVTFRGTGDATVRLELTERTDCIRLERRIHGVPVEEFLRYPGHQEEAELIAREMEILHRDHPYERTMRRLSGLLAEYIS
jgi:glucose-6-phosphate dehydrogenase assembly protein OpcA